LSNEAFDSDFDSDNDDVGNETLFMVKGAMIPKRENSLYEGSCDNSDEEELGDNLETELMRVQEELKHVEKKNNKLKARFKEYEENIHLLEERHWIYIH
ncbi:hypothetical protein KI387_010106, partial [Taxus chinensis]